MTEPNGNGRKIDVTKTFVPLTLVGSIVWAAFHVGSAMTEFKSAVHDVRVENEAEMKLLATQIADRWHKSDMRSFAELLQANNPGMKVPEIR